jgi:septal ring factor EnvC (AmiA/AmiB activator)
MSVLLLAALISDPQMNQIVLEGRSQETRVELSFRGKPTFQSFRSHAPNTLVVDVVGASLPAGFPSQVEVIEGVTLHLTEHVGSRTRLMRLRLTLPTRLEPQLQASPRAIHLTLPIGSVVARAIGPSGAAPQLEKALASRLQERLKGLEKEHSTARGQLTQKEEQIERLSRRLRDALSKVNSLDTDLKAKNQRYASSEIARKRAEGQAKEALKAVQATQAQVAGEVGGLRRREAKQVQLSSKSLQELVARRADIDRLLREQESIKSKLSALSRVTQKQARESKRLVQTEVGLRADVDASSVALAARRAELRRLNRKVGESEQSIGTLRAKSKKYDRSIGRTNAKIVRRTKDLKVIKSDRSRLQESLKSLEAKLARRQAAATELDALYIAVRDEVSGIDKRLKTAVGERKALGKALRSMRAELKATQRTIDQKKAQAKRAVTQAVALERELKGASSEQGKLVAQLEAARATAQGKQRALRALRDKLAPVAKQRKELLAALAAEQALGASADAEVVKLSAALSAREKQLKTEQAQLARLQRQRRAQLKRVAQLAAKNKATQMSAAVTAKRLAKAQAKPVVKAKPVLVAAAKPVGKKRKLSDAQSGAGFGGGPKLETGRFERIGYRPVGPERVLIRFGGDGNVTLSKTSSTATRVRMPGVSASTKRLRALDTSLFGGLVQSIRPRRTRRGMWVELRHEAGVEFRVVRTVSGAELRVR